jgi:hypothetical protein
LERARENHLISTPDFYPTMGASSPIVDEHGRSPERQRKQPAVVIERHCITTVEGRGLGWIATAHPGLAASRARLSPGTMATHCDHATNMSITSQHVSIVERLVGRHSPT